MTSLLLAVVLIGSSLVGQTFDVASVKARVQEVEQIRPSCAGNRFLSKAPIDEVVRFAYDLNAAQFKEVSQQLPNWARTPTSALGTPAYTSGPYDIEATAVTAVSESQCRKMVQNLLAERFKLMSHWEAARGDTYTMVVAKGGPKMPIVTERDQGRGVSETKNGRAVSAAAPGTPVRRGLTMDELATFLSRRLLPQVPVINNTGLAGSYKITLSYSWGGPDADADLLAAVEKQLGLKLERTKGQVNRLILESIQRPSEN